MNFRQVSFREYKDILYPLFEVHWNEVSLYKDSIPLALDIETYDILETAGKFITIIAEVDNEIVGYVCYILGRHPHYVTSIVAQNDAIFLLPSFRGGRNALNMLKFAETVLKDNNVDIISAHVKSKRDFSGLLKFIGYTEQEVVYTKRLK